MYPGFQCHVQKPSYLTMSSWEGWIEVTSSEVTTAAVRKVKTFISVYLIFYSMLPLPMHLYCTAKISDFRVQLANELISDYCSRWRVGRQGSFLKNSPLRHFSVKLEPADTTRCNRHRCTRCLDKYGKRTDTQWFCQECAVPLYHTGKPSTDCFLHWHKNMDLDQ